MTPERAKEIAGGVCDLIELLLNPETDGEHASQFSKEILAKLDELVDAASVSSPPPMNEGLVERLQELRAREADSTRLRRLQTSGQFRELGEVKERIATLDEAIAALSSPPPKGEAVAWAVVDRTGDPWVFNDSEGMMKRECRLMNADDTDLYDEARPFRVVPLFTHPTPSVPQSGVTRELHGKLTAAQLFFDRETDIERRRNLPTVEDVMQFAAERTAHLEAIETVLVYLRSPESDDATAPQERT